MAAAADAASLLSRFSAAASLLSRFTAAAASLLSKFTAVAAIDSSRLAHPSRRSQTGTSGPNSEGERRSRGRAAPAARAADGAPRRPASPFHTGARGGGALPNPRQQQPSRDGSSSGSSARATVGSRWPASPFQHRGGGAPPPAPSSSSASQQTAHKVRLCLCSCDPCPQFLLIWF